MMQLDHGRRSPLLTALGLLCASALAACSDSSNFGTGGYGGGASATGVGGSSSADAGTGSGTGPGGGIDLGTVPPNDESTASTGALGFGGGDSAGSGGGSGGEVPVCDPAADVFTGQANVVVDDSNSYASPLLVKELIADPLWSADVPLPVRPHEFLNYYVRPVHQGPLASSVAGLDVGADAQLLQVGAGGRLAELLVTVSSDGALETLPPDVTFLLDTSTSMDGEGTARLEGVIFGADAAIRAEQSVAVLTSSATDRVVRAMAPWNGDVLPILDAATRLSADADFSVSLWDALDVARLQAQISKKPGIVVAISDGSTALDPAVAAQVTAARQESPPVRVVGIGVGPARGYFDDVLDELTDRSGGAYFYAPDAETAERELAARFDELTRIAARDVSLQLDLPDGVRLAAVAGGPGEIGDGVLAEGQNLGLGGTMAFHVYLNLAPELDPCVGVGVQLRWTDPESGMQRVHPDPANAELPLTLRLEQALSLGESRGPGLARASAIVAAAEALRGPTEARLARAAERLQHALKVSGEPADELGDLCGQVLQMCARTSAVCVDCASF